MEVVFGTPNRKLLLIKGSGCRVSGHRCEKKRVINQSKIVFQIDVIFNQRVCFVTYLSIKLCG